MSRVATSSTKTVSRVRESRGPQPLAGTTLHNDDQHQPEEKTKPGPETEDERGHQTEPAVTVDVGSSGEAVKVAARYPDAAMTRARLKSESGHAQLDHLVQNPSLQPGHDTVLDPAGPLADQLGDLTSEAIEPEPTPQAGEAYASLPQDVAKRSNNRIFALLETLSLARQSGDALSGHDSKDATLPAREPDFALAYGAILLAIATGNPRFLLNILAGSNAADHVSEPMFEPLSDEITELSLDYFGYETEWQQLPIPLPSGEGFQLFLEWEKGSCRASSHGETPDPEEKQVNLQNNFTLILAFTDRPDLRLRLLATRERLDARFSAGHSISVADQKKIEHGFRSFLADAPISGKIYFDGPHA